MARCPGLRRHARVAARRRSLPSSRRRRWWPRRRLGIGGSLSDVGRSSGRRCAARSGSRRLRGLRSPERPSELLRRAEPCRTRIRRLARLLVPFGDGREPARRHPGGLPLTRTEVTLMRLDCCRRPAARRRCVRARRSGRWRSSGWWLFVRLTHDRSRLRLFSVQHLHEARRTHNLRKAEPLLSGGECRGGEG